MANDEVIGPRKTMFVLVIVVGCFAVLWPRILSPLVLGPTRDQIQPNQFDRDAGCCEVIFETDVAVLELVNEVCSSTLGVGKLSSHSSVAECRKAVNDTCGVDIAVFLKRNENVGKTTKMLVETMQNSNSSCLREHFGVPIYSLGPHFAANSWNIKDTLKQERAPPIRGMGPHPALRERGRAIPPGPPGPPPTPSRPVTLPPHVRVRSPLSVYYRDEQPPPIPGMRPPLGSPGGPVAAPKSSMGFVMPIYTICIIVFFVYTLTKIMFRRQGAPYDPITPDPHFRRRVFRDDSRSSPDKLGKKEADTIVTAISGLVAEVQQQMEASGAPNQQRQDVQDSARPFTNGTILLNSGPVQIVTSEYKEASKEKTPEPVIGKQSMPEPTQAEISKVLKEPVSEEDECNLEPKDSHSEVEQSPEPFITQQENQAILKTVVNKKSSPESVVECSLTSHTKPKLVKKEPTLDPNSNQSDEPSIYEVAEDSVSETLSESDVVLDSTLKSNLNLVEALSVSELSEDIALVSDVKAISSELKESVLETKELLTKLLEQTAEVKEDLLEPNKSPSELVKSTLDSNPEKNIESALLKKSSTDLVEESSLQPIVTTPELKDPSLDLLTLAPEPNEMNVESIETTPELNEPLLDSLTQNIIPEETSPEPNGSIIRSKELPLQSEEPHPQPNESSIKLEDSITEANEPLLQPELAIPAPKDPPFDLLPLETEPDENLLEPIEPTPEHKESLLETVVPPKPEDTESNESLSNIKEPVHEPVIITPEQQTVTEDTDQSILEHKDSATHKVSTPELLEKSTDIKEPIEKCSSESKIPEYSPKIEAQNVDRSPEPELIENSPNLEAPAVECSSEPEHTVQSLEVDTPDIGSSSGCQSESLILKDPTPQSKETTPERKLTPEPKTIQGEQNDTVSEGALLDLEEAIADEDDRTEKQDKKVKLTDAESKLQTRDRVEQEASEELLKIIEDTEALNDIKDDAAKANDKFLQGERFVVVRRSTPDVIEENKKLHPYESKPADDYKLYTEADEEDIENAAVKVMAMEMTAHPVDGSEWPRDERPPPPAAPASPPPRAPHAAEDVKSIFLETEIPQQSRVLVAQFEEDRPHPAAHAPLVVSGKMTLSLIQDAPRETPDRDPESTLDEFTTASAVTQAAAEKGEIESDEEIDEEIEVEEIELEEEEEEEEPPPVKVAGKK